MKQVLYKNRYLLISVAAVLVLLGVWELVACTVKLEIALPTFTSTCVSFGLLFTKGDTYAAVGWTLLRCLIGFTIGFTLGVLLGIAAGKKRALSAVISPVTSVMRSVPVAAITLALTVFVSEYIVPALIGVMLVFPIVYQQIKTATENIDPALCDVLTEMGSGFWHSARTVYLPLVLPNMLSCITVSFGMNVKAVISAEILAYTAKSIGYAIYYAKADFLHETPTLFAWVLLSVLLSVFLECALRFAVAKITKRISWIQAKEK